MKRRTGFSLIETMASLVLLSLLMIVMTKLAGVKVQETKLVDTQYAMLEADAFMADIYDSWHDAKTWRVSSSPGGQLQLIFEDLQGSSVVYAFAPSTGEFTKDGVKQFKGSSFKVEGAGNGMTIAIKVPGQKVLEATFYK